MRRAAPPRDPATVTVAPPAELAWLAAIVGVDGAFRLVDSFGGRRTYIPARARPSSRLARAVGVEGVRLLAAELGGARMIKLPAAKRWRVLVHRSAGCSYGEIAERVGLDESSVARYLRGAGATSRQPDLPGL